MVTWHREWPFTTWAFPLEPPVEQFFGSGIKPAKLDPWARDHWVDRGGLSKNRGHPILSRSNAQISRLKLLNFRAMPMPIPSPIPPVLVGVSPDLRTTSATVDMIVGDQVRKVDGNAMGIWIQHRIFITIQWGFTSYSWEDDYGL